MLRRLGCWAVKSIPGGQIKSSTFLSGCLGIRMAYTISLSQPTTSLSYQVMSPLWILSLQTLTSSFHQLPWVCNHGDSCFTQLPNLATDDANSVSQSHSCLAWQKQGTFAPTGKTCSLLDVMRECMESVYGLYNGYMGCFQACVKGRLASNVFCAAAFSAHILRVPKLCQGKSIAVRATQRIYWYWWIHSESQPT